MGASNHNRKTEDNTALQNILELMIKSRPLDELLGNSLDILLSLDWLDFLPRAGIFLVEKETDGTSSLRLVAGREMGKSHETICPTVKFGSCLCGKSALNQSVIYKESLDSSHETSYEGMEPHGHYIIPILSERRTLGIIMLVLPDGAKKNDREIHFLEQVADMLALIIAVRKKNNEPDRKYDADHPVIWPEGRPLNMLNMQQNGNRQKYTERALAESEQHLREIQTLAHMGHWQTNMITGRRRWSDEIYRIIGHEPGSFEPDAEFFYEIVHPDDLERVHKSAEWAEQTGHKDIVYRIVKPDGTICHVHDRATADIDSDGNLMMLSGTVQDITDRVEIECRLQEAEERFAFAVEDVNDSFWDWDMENDTVQFSRLYEKMLGYTETELPRHIDSWYNNIHPDDFARTRQCLRNYVRGRTAKFAMELQMRCKDGSYKWILCRSSIISRDDNGKPRRIFSIHRDISKQKHIEQELALARGETENANHAKIQFLSGISGKLSPSLDAIMEYGRRLQREKDPPLSDFQRENVNNIIGAGSHLLRLINEMQDLANVGEGHIDLSIEPMILAKVIVEALEQITPLAQRRGIEIILTWEGNDLTVKQLLQDDHTIRADHSRLRQILYNLLSNGVKYNCENGDLVINCSDTEDNRIRITVTDTGPGLTPEHLGQLFNTARRVETGQPDSEANAISLAMTKKLVELMEGAIGVESQLGAGSSFWIEFPVIPAVE